MRLRESREQDVDVFHLEGEIDLHYAPALRSLFRAKLHQRCPALVLDLSGVSFLDSTGISVLLEYLRDATEFGGRFYIAGPTDHVRHVFEITRLVKVLSIFTDVATAAAAVHSGTGAPAAAPLFGRSDSERRPAEGLSSEVTQ